MQHTDPTQLCWEMIVKSALFKGNVLKYAVSLYCLGFTREYTNSIIILWNSVSNGVLSPIVLLSLCLWQTSSHNLFYPWIFIAVFMSSRKLLSYLLAAKGNINIYFQKGIKYRQLYYAFRICKAFIVTHANSRLLLLLHTKFLFKM